MKLLYTTLVLLLTVGVGVERSLLLVDADSIIIAAVVADQRGIDDAIDEPSSTSRIAEEEKDGDESREGGDTVVEPDDADDVPPEVGVHLPWPTSLAKAARIGAIITGGEIPEEGGRSEKGAADVVVEESEMTSSPDANTDEEEGAGGAPHDNPKMMTTGCHWGSTMGCKKGGIWNNNAAAAAAAAGGVEMNSSSSSSSSSVEDYNNADAAAGLAGSASAKIEARVMNGRGGASLMQRRPPGTPTSVLDEPDDDDADHPEVDRKDHAGGGYHEPPRGFRLAGRIVTSPADGLSYFLDDAHQVFDPDDDDGNNGDWMMTIPYRYLECGPTIESTTEAFPLHDMILRHLPHSASMGHWMNLGGGVTIIENGINNNEGKDDGEGGGTTTRYIDTDGHNEGHPKLLVALSPLEITVSGNNEESRRFHPGDVILMEDTLGKGHKMNAAPPVIRGEISQPASRKNTDTTHGQDLFVIMVSLPHTIHLPIYDWRLEGSSNDLHEIPSPSPERGFADGGPDDDDPGGSEGADEEEEQAERALLGFAPKHLHRQHRMSPRNKRSSSLVPGESKRPCPLEYDSAYSSLFVPRTTHNQYERLRRGSSRSQSRGGRGGRQQIGKKDSSFDETHRPPPWYSTHGKESIWFRYLPSLRRTMLVGLGLSLTSSFAYCVQLLYPPLLALWGGATMILGGALMNVLVTRWSYRRFVADWLEEWRWRREVRRYKMHREGLMKEEQEEFTVDDDGRLRRQSIEDIEKEDESFVSDNVESV